MHLVSLSSLLFALFLSISHALITSESEAVALAPVLKIHGDELEAVLEGYRSIHYSIAALRMRTLIPHYTLSSNSKSNSNNPKRILSFKLIKNITADSKQQQQQHSDSDNEFNSEIILVNHLENFLRGVNNRERVAQVFSFNLSNATRTLQDLADFTAQKEAEAQAKLLEAAPIIQAIKSLLKIESSSSHTDTSFAFLKPISNTLSYIYPNLKDIEIYSPRLDSQDQVKRKEAQKYVTSGRARIFKWTLKLSALLSP